MAQNLKAYDLPVDHGDFATTVELFYLKSEADKVIAELEESHKKEVSQLLILNREQANSANRLRDSMEQVIHHQKYKRCLAMADYCYTNVHCIMGHWLCALSVRKKEWFDRWRKRWLELAEKFKPSDTTVQQGKG